MTPFPNAARMGGFDSDMPNEPFFAKLLSLGVSQLYISKEKLAAVEAWRAENDPKIHEPLPVRDFGNGRLTLTDGHTRAFAAYGAGETEILVAPDDDEIVTCERGQRLYRACIAWCDAASVYTVKDFDGRVLDAEDYQRLWNERCDRLHEEA